MATHRISIELSDFAYTAMHRRMETTGFNSESEVLEDLLCEAHLETQENAQALSSPWTPQEIDDILAEADADPDGGFTLEQVREHLTRKRGTLVEAA